MEPIQTPGDLFRAARENANGGKGLLQREVAAQAGVSVSFVSQVESGYRPRRVDALERIAVAVGASAGSFGWVS